MLQTKNIKPARSLETDLQMADQVMSGNASARLAASGEARPEQWQAQILALIQRRANILVHSSLPDEIIRAAHLKPCRDIAATVAETLKHLGGQARVAVLPQGPLTIPYLKPAGD